MARAPSPELGVGVGQHTTTQAYQAASNDAVILTNVEMERARSQSSTPSISSSSYTNRNVPLMPFGSSSTPFASSSAIARSSSNFGTASPYVQQKAQDKAEQEREGAERAALAARCARDEEIAAAFVGSIAERKGRRASKPIVDLAEVKPPPPTRRPSQSSSSRPTPPAAQKAVPIRVPTLHSPAPTGVPSRSPSVNPPVAAPSSPEAGPGPKTQAKRKTALSFAVEIPVSKKQKKVATPEKMSQVASAVATPARETTSPVGLVAQPHQETAQEATSEKVNEVVEEAVEGAVADPTPLPRKREATRRRRTQTYPSVFTVKPAEPSTSASRLQDRSCQAFATDSATFPPCFQCIAKNSSACSFRNRRFRPIPPRDSAGKLKDALFLPHIRADDEPIFPTQYSSPFTEHHASEIKTTVAHVLAAPIAVEEAHARRERSVKQRLVLKDHNTCDGCLTTIFIGSWLCRHCGRELCLDCAEALERCHQAPSTSKGELEHRNRLMRCSNGHEVHGGVDIEQAGDHVPMTKVSKDELRSMRRAMEAWNAEHPAQDPPSLDQDVLDYLYALDPTAYSSPAETCHPYLRLPVGLLDRRDPPAPHPSPRPPTTTTDSVLLKLDSMDPSTLFHALWSRGETMVVDVDLSRYLSQEWDPERFIKNYGKLRCTIASNTGGPDVLSDIGEFFKRFDQFNSGEDGESLKLKDFPPTKDFKKELPDLFREFMSALPAGIVTRRDGPLNIAAHSPVNSNVPDLGPKGYWSQISNDAPGGHGSTKLHSDLADAANILLWSKPMPDGSPGLAAWDIYRAEDSEKIRDFLYELKTKQLQATTGQLDIAVDDVRASHDDPIHSQEFFLDSALRAELLEEKGVKSWRIWQRPGQVVFIPAGCAHQVCNFSHCIKIAVDFVSRENVNRCWTVTDEFREQTKGRDLWREDVLQLKNQLLWAWRSCERFDLGKVEKRSTKANGAAQKGDEGAVAMEVDDM